MRFDTDYDGVFDAEWQDERPLRSAFALVQLALRGRETKAVSLFGLRVM
jgi:hypothetical protein